MRKGEPVTLFEKEKRRSRLYPPRVNILGGGNDIPRQTREGGVAISARKSRGEGSKVKGRPLGK